MKLISAFGSPFSHDITSCHNIAPTKFKWVFDQPTNSDIEVYFEYNILGGQNSNSKNKFLWLCESRSIVQPQMLFVKNNYNYLKQFYKKIFTHDRSLLELNEIFSYCPPAANHTWVKDRGIHKKSKMVSMVSSGKTMCEGHIYRNNKMKEFQNSGYPIDYYGKLFNPFNVKEDVLRDYYYSITIENDSYSNYYTEKLMDCFACGTIPIYQGTPEIKNMFNMDGVIILDQNFNINMLSSEYYYSKIDAIKDNYERCLTHKPSDDYLYDEIIKFI